MKFWDSQRLATVDVRGILGRGYSDVRFSIREWWQRRTRGYSGFEVWELRTAAARYILPRLRALKTESHGLNCCEYKAIDEWQWSAEDFEKAAVERAANFDLMIYAMEFCAHEELCREYDEEKVQRGCEMLGRFWLGLWD